MGLSACHSAHKIAVPELLWELRRVSHQKLAALGHIQLKSLKLSSPKSASSSARKLGTKSLEGSVFVKGKGWLNTLYIYILSFLVESSLQHVFSPTPNGDDPFAFNSVCQAKKEEAKHR